MRQEFYHIRTDYLKSLFIKLSIVALLVAADIFTKAYFYYNLEVGEGFAIIPRVLSFVYVKNTGAGFSLFQGQTVLLSVISALFIVAIFIYDFFRFDKSRWYLFSLVFIVAGALGNFIDRVSYGFVVDFIKLDFINFPIFNLADIFLTVGIVIYAVYIFFFYEEEHGKIVRSGK